MDADLAQSLPTPPPIEWLTFSGNTSDNVLLFAQAVHRFAFAHGRHEHGAWIAAYAYGCLTDMALDWFEDLDPKAKWDWSTLRPAMIKRFRQDKFVPSAPAAAPGPRQARKSSTSRARVMLVRYNGLVVGYVGRPASRGHTLIEAKPEGALVLDVPIGQSSEKADNLTLLATSGDSRVDSHPFIGLEHTPDHWRLRACDQGRDGDTYKGRARALTDTATPVASSKIWVIHKIDASTEELRVQWTEDNGYRTSLQAVQHPSSKDFWVRKAPMGTELSLKMILERF
ncbi:hypothetical protein FRB98_007242 [Tulasnella sp. 332]|nr:hypothetical protein FRB98_007242 [Tulasnella sp. 332]